MSVIGNSVILRCAPEVVFDYLSDLRAELEWNPNCEGMEKLTDGPVGLGTRYRAKWKGSSSVELDTVAFDRPHGWTTHNAGPIEITFTCRLEPIPHHWFRLIYPFFLIIIRRQEKANMGFLQDAVARRAAARG